ncbi:hypothetical protein J4E91_005078 [Alternaria rosae]|nr:hypothetical protein J4E91_005078 [Alternaria rosae]
MSKGVDFAISVRPNSEERTAAVRRSRRPTAQRLFSAFELRAKDDGQLLVDEVRRLGCGVTWKNVPTDANQLIFLDDFSVTLPSLALDVPEDLEIYVDGRPSCAMVYTCIESQASDTALCVEHVRRLEDLVKSHRWTVNCIIGNIAADLTLKLPERSADEKKVRSFFETCKQVRLDNIWSTDAEGLVVENYIAIPMQVGITSVLDRSRAYEGYIKYRSVSFATATANHTAAVSDADQDGSLQTRISGFLRIHYNPDQNARLMESHRAELREIGFEDETAGIVLEWGATRLDADVLARIEHREDQVLVA